MSIATDLETKLKNNQHTIFITEADDLLAAWQYKRKSTSKRSKNLCAVPTEWRYSAPPNGKSQCMPCHVSYRRKAGRSFSTVEPAFAYKTSFCHHTHGRRFNISIPDLDTLEAVTFAKRNIAPYVSPILDAHTLALVSKDLGIMGKAVPKVIDGRQYIAFVDTNGFRTIFPNTLYAAKNRRIIKMAIGALGLKNMVKNGGTLTICITVPLTILECFLSDHATLSQFAGHLLSDLLQIGIASVIGAIFGIAMGGVVTVASVPIATAILIGVLVGAGLDTLDEHFQLTEKLVVVLDKIGNEIANTTNNAIYEAEATIYQGFWDFLGSHGLRYYKPY